MSAQRSRGFRVDGERRVSLSYMQNAQAIYMPHTLGSLHNEENVKPAAFAEWDRGPIAAVEFRIVSAERLARNSFRYRMSVVPCAPFSAAHLTDIEKIDQKCKSGFKRRAGREEKALVKFSGTETVLLFRSCRRFTGTDLK